MFAINCEKYGGRIPPNRYELDSKYKLIIELSNKLYLQHKQVQTLKQLYSNNLIDLRRQISEEISLLFRYAPIEYGRFCEDTLWKRNYYDCVKYFKSFRRSLSSAELEKQSELFRSHLISGIGHYHSLLQSFRKLFHLSNLDEILFLPIISEKFPNYTLQNCFNNLLGGEIITPPIVNNLQHQNEEQTIRRFDIDEDSEDEAQIDFDIDYTHDEKFKETLLFLAHRFFICLGDLTRYYSDFFCDNENRSDDHYFNMAIFYYKSASLLQPHLGMPYNQLGTLHSASNCLDSLYYYFRCLNSKKPFVGIKDNLRQTFEHARKQHKLEKTEMNNRNHTNGFVTINEQDYKTDSDLARSTIFRMINVYSLLFKLIDEFENNSKLIPIENILSNLYETLILFRNALNIECEQEGTQSKVNRFSTETIFKIISIVMVLIDQTKIIFRKNSIEIDLAQINTVLNSSNMEELDIQIRANFLLYLLYQFLFQMITMVIHRECETLKRMLYASHNLMDDNPIMMMKPKSTLKKYNNKKNYKKTDVARKRCQYSQSFSSDYGDHLDETMSQLKNTAFQTIQDILDSSENEDGEENLIAFEDINDVEIKLINRLNDCDEDNPCSESTDLKTFDQILAFLYTESSTPIIKFFCDYLQSNDDFMDILKNMPVLLEYFYYFFQYLNIISEFDFNSLANFKSYLEEQFYNNNGSSHNKEKLNKLMDLFNFINKCSHYTVKDFKQIWPLSSEMAYMNLTEDLSNFYKPLFKCQNEIDLMNLQNELTIEKSSYLCIRCLLIFGIKLSLLSLENNKFKLSVENLDLTTVHNIKQNKNVSFVYQLLQPIESSILKNDGYLLVKKIKPDQQLISFDCNDKEIDNVGLHDQQQHPNNDDNSNQNSFDQNQVDSDENNKTNTSNTPVQGSSKSLYDLEKLPYIMIDPYVYLENIEQIKKIVKNKKAFLIVPKLVSDFLNNLKTKGIPSAIEAADFLQEEFFRGSRMIRFIRNDDRLELEMLNYPKNFHWRRTINNENELQDLDFLNSGKNQEQDLALFYELLEHCHYLLVNKVLVNKRVLTFYDNARDNHTNKSNVRITLITNNLSKWPPNSSTTIAQTCGIDIETMESYMANKQNKNKTKTRHHKRNHRHTPNNNRSPQSHFRPIQFMANNNSEMSANRHVT